MTLASKWSVWCRFEFTDTDTDSVLSDLWPQGAPRYKTTQAKFAAVLRHLLENGGYNALNEPDFVVIAAIDPAVETAQEGLLNTLRELSGYKQSLDYKNRKGQNS